MPTSFITNGSCTARMKGMLPSDGELGNENASCQKGVFAEVTNVKFSDNNYKHIN